MRDKIRAKYSDWDSFVLPIGRLAEYSSLRKLLMEKFKIYETSFGKKISIVFQRVETILITLRSASVFQTEDKQPLGSSSSPAALSLTRVKAPNSPVE